MVGRGGDGGKRVGRNSIRSHRKPDDEEITPLTTPSLTMGVSPKKKSNNDDAPAVNPDHLKGFGVAVALLCTIYLLTIPSSSSSGDESETSLFNVRSVNRTGEVPPRKKDDLLFYENEKGGEFSPQIAWLMSYPNSGTSFTMTCVERTSNLSTATNYGDEVTAQGDYSLPIYPQHPEGPFWEGMSGKLGAIRPLPNDYVLVKTHCGSRCIKCPPSEYVETLDSFVDACRLTSGRVAPDRHREEYKYPVERVKKAIHLIRNPYHNFVARFHLERKNAIANKKDDWVEAHPSTSEGFQKWCLELDDMYKKKEYEIFDKDMLHLMRSTPCHGEVFKFVQWHNLAFQLTKKYGIESMRVMYGDYVAKFDETVDGMLHFLKLERAQPPRTFDAGHEYADYYTADDKQRIRVLAEKIASETTWSHIKQFFDNSTAFFQIDLPQDQAPKRAHENIRA